MVIGSGRLRNFIEFKQQEAVDNGYGGTTVTEVTVLQTYAAKERLNSDDQLRLQEGISDFVRLRNFIIRDREGFFPTIDMTATIHGETWTILGVTELDDPESFLRLLCGIRK